MNVSEVMNKQIKTIQPDASIVEAARQMRDGDFGVLPVVDGDNVVGMITDRDLAVRVIAEDKDVHECTVEDAMTADLLSCHEDDSVEDVARLMAERQVRRIPVMSADNKLVGIVSVGDVAIYNQDQAAEALGGISEQRHDEPGQQLTQ